MLEAAIVAGITSVGRDAVSLGIVPTPAVACVTRPTDAAAGVVISASHNPIADNGIKFFGSDGFKLSDELEDRDRGTARIAESFRARREPGSAWREWPKISRGTIIAELYDGAPDLRGLHVVVDGGFGAAFAIAPYALRKLGAEVTEINCENDGARINVQLRCDGSAVRCRRRFARETRRANGASSASRSTAMRIERSSSTKPAAIVTGDHVHVRAGVARCDARGEFARRHDRRNRDEQYRLRASAARARNRA